MIDIQTVNKIVEFSRYVSLDISNLPTRIVDGLKTYFGYNAVYVIHEFDELDNASVFRLHGDNTYSRDHSLYKEELIGSDVFAANMKKIINDTCTMQKHAWRCQDLECGIEEFWTSDFGNKIRKGGFGYKALITCPQPVGRYHHSISIYKPERKGDFTDDEMQLFDWLGIVFNTLQNIYRKRLDNDSLLSLICEYVIKDDRCVCVTNSQFNPLFKTPQFGRLSEELFSGRDLVSLYIPQMLGFSIASTGYSRIVQEQHRTKAGNCTVTVSAYTADLGKCSHTNTLFIIEILHSQSMTSAADQDDLLLSKCAALTEKFGLTGREADILKLLTEGVSVQEAAEKTCLSKATVRTHIAHIYQKLGVNNRVEAMAMAMVMAAGE